MSDPTAPRDPLVYVQLWRKGAQPTVIFTYSEVRDAPDDGLASRAFLCMGPRYYMEGDEMAVLVGRALGDPYKATFRRFTAVPSTFHVDAGRVRARWALADG